MAVTVDEHRDVAQTLALAGIVHHPERDVGTVKRADKRGRISEAELSGDVVARETVGRRCERHDRHVGIKLLQPRETGVVRSEIMSPLRDAVSLVDGNQTYRKIARPAVDFHQKAFGRYVENLDAACEKLLEYIVVLGLGLH